MSWSRSAIGAIIVIGFGVFTIRCVNIIIDL